jgi:two-component system, NarL family, response regulator NreC
MPIRILLADDHALIRQGLKALLEKHGFQVVCEASDGQETLRSAQQALPDVAIVDISMPILNGVDTARELKKSAPKTKVILLTQHDEDQYVTESLRAGVRGYVLKSQAGSDLIHAIQEVCRGSVYLSPNRAPLWMPIYPKHLLPPTLYLAASAKSFNWSAKANPPKTSQYTWVSA